MLFEQLKKISGKGILTGTHDDDARELVWVWHWGNGVSLYEDSGGVLAHADLHTLEAWGHPEIIKWGDDSITDEECTAFESLCEEIADYERGNFRVLEAHINKIFNVIGGLKGLALPVYNWADDGYRDTDAIDQILTDYVLRSAITLCQFVGDSVDLELLCREETGEAVWTLAFDMVTGFLESQE